jgi:hypothetical protein
VLHARSAFVDKLSEGQRHLLRLWLSLDEASGWELPQAFAEGRYANIQRLAGPVGGIEAQGGAAPTFPLHPE